MSIQTTASGHRRSLYPRSGHSTHSGLDPAGRLFVLAEGVGDLFIADHASRLTCEVCVREMLSLSEAPGAPTPPDRNIQQTLQRALNEAEREMQEAAAFNPSLRGAASRCSLVYFSDHSAHIGHVGDTRVYLGRKGIGFRALTLDHRAPSEGADEALPTRALGFSNVEPCDRLQIDLATGDWLLMVSSGLAALLDSDGLGEMLDDLEPDAAAAALCDRGLQSGCEEVSALCVRIDAVAPRHDRIGMQARLNLLGALPLFEDLDDQELLLLLPLISEVRLQAGERLIEEGRFERSLYVLVDGRCQVLRGPNDYRVAELQPGELIGELSLGDHLPRSASVVAATSCKLLQFDGEAFERFTRSSPLGPKLLWNLIRCVTSRCREISVMVSSRNEAAP